MSDEAESPATSQERRTLADLLTECEQVAKFRRYSGLGSDDEFWRAIAAARSPQVQASDDPRALELMRLLAARSEGIAFPTLAALRGGWDPGAPRFRAKAGTIVLALLATLLVLFTGSLTYVYNDGVAIATDLKALEPAEVRQSYDRLIRDMLQASRQVDEALAPADRSAEELSQFDLARNVYYDKQTEVSELSRRLEHAQQRALAFTTKHTLLHMPGAEEMACGLDWVSVGLDTLVAWTASLGSDDRGGDGGAGFSYGDCVASFDVSIDADLATLASTEGYDQDWGGSCPEDAPIIEASLVPVAKAMPTSFRAYATQVDDMATELLCRRLIVFLPSTYPQITAYLTQVSAALTPMAVIFLPALYGAMGAIMSLMRVVIDPLTPGPGFFGTFHRVTFGAVAGVVLVWFFTPDSDLSREIGDIGLTLFGLTFLVGFSLDFFFSILDRFVALTSTGVGRMGGPTGK